MCAVVDSGRLWRVPESSGAGWCRFRRQVAEGSSGGKSVRWRIGSGGRVRKVRESSGVICCLATLTGAAMYCFEHLLVMTLSTWATQLRKRDAAHVVKHGIRIYICVYIYIYDVYAIAVGDTAKAYF